MNNSHYSGMLNGLSQVNLSGFERAQAELHLRRAAAFVQMLMGPNKERVAETVCVEAPAEYRKAA